MFASKVMVNILAESLVQENEHNLSAPQFRILDTVYHGADKPADIARMLDVSPSAITWLLDRLEQAGFMERRPGTGDRRRVVLLLTDEGRDVVRRVNNRRRAHLKRVLDGMDREAVVRLQNSLEAFSKSYVKLKKQH